MDIPQAEAAKARHTKRRTSKQKGTIDMKNRIAAAVIGATFFSIPAWAHHAFSSEFDIRKPIHLSGVLTEAEFINPHAWLHVAVKGEDGAAEVWIIVT